MVFCTMCRNFGRCVGGCSLFGLALGLALSFIGVGAGYSGESESQAAAPPRRPNFRPRIVQESWRPTTAKERAAGQRVVQEHLRAFRNKNWQKALDIKTRTFASAYATPQDLADLIERSYPAFGRVQSIRWRRAEFNDIDQSMWIGFRFSTTHGEIVGVRYSLQMVNNRYYVSGIAPTTITQTRRVAQPWPFKPAFN